MLINMILVTMFSCVCVSMCNHSISYIFILRIFLKHIFFCFWTPIASFPFPFQYTNINNDIFSFIPLYLPYIYIYYLYYVHTHTRIQAPEIYIALEAMRLSLLFVKIGYYSLYSSVSSYSQITLHDRTLLSQFCKCNYSF